MNNNFFDDDFKVKEYISKRMLEIEDLKERVIYREIAEKVLIDLYEYHQEQYSILCDNIIKQVKSEEKLSSLYIGLTTRNKFDETDGFLYPMQKEDSQNNTIDIIDIIETIKNNENYFLFNIYLDETYQNVVKFKENNAYFTGIIITSTGEFKVKFNIEFNSNYLDLIKSLYSYHILNAKSWFTMCTAYLHRIFSVSVCEIIDTNIDGDLLDIKINMLDLEDKTYYDVIPLWNIKSICETTSSYPRPVKSSINYQHKIFAHKLNSNSNYLATNNEVLIQNVYRSNGDLIIISNQSIPVDWNLIEICEFKESIYEFKPLTNHYNIEFADELMKIYKTSIKTKHEIKRFLKKLPYFDYLIFNDISILNKYNNVIQTYDVDEFIIDEIRNVKDKKFLLLTFDARDVNNVLNYDLMSFLVTHIQKLFPEYNCIGELN